MAESTKTVVVAVAANAVIAVAKYAAAVITGSASMLAEAMHSTVDTGNEALLLLGLRRSQRPADEAHPFGYGQELYFWSLVVAVVIFGAGGGAAMWEGVLHLLQPRPVEATLWNYIVLGVALIFESISWSVAYRAVRSDFPQRPILQAIRTSKDPSHFVVLLEDTAAIAGLLIALVIGTFLAQVLRMEALDGVASVLIGLVLIATAVFLIAETRALLIGESASQETVERIRAIAHADPGVESVGRVLTMQLSPERILLNLELRFAGGTPDIPAAIARVEAAIKHEFADISEIFIEAQGLITGERPE